MYRLTTFFDIYSRGLIHRSEGSINQIRSTALVVYPSDPTKFDQNLPELLDQVQLCASLQCRTVGTFSALYCIFKNTRSELSVLNSFRTRIVEVSDLDPLLAAH